VNFCYQFNAPVQGKLYAKKVTLKVIVASKTTNASSTGTKPTIRPCYCRSKYV